MKGPTHLAAGLVAGVAVSAALHHPPALATIGMAAIGSLLPDLDQRAPLRWFTQHRTFTHSLLLLALAFKIAPWLALGMATHIALDMLTPMRVPIFWPWEQPIGVGLVRTGSVAEFGVAAVLMGFLLSTFWGPLSIAARQATALPQQVIRAAASAKRPATLVGIPLTPTKPPVKNATTSKTASKTASH